MEKMTREELERIALLSVTAEDYYDLADTMDSVSDELLYEIIEQNQSDNSDTSYAQYDSKT